VKERSEHVHEAAERFLHPYFEGILFPGSTEVFWELDLVLQDQYSSQAGWFMFPETDFTTPRKLTSDPERFKQDLRAFHRSHGLTNLDY